MGLKGMDDFVPTWDSPVLDFGRWYMGKGCVELETSVIGVTGRLI